MLNTKKLLYILPDLAYVTELLPAKKEYTFAIQAFRQVNGEFLNDNELIPPSIEKLFSKLEKEEYHLVLPDFLFTNTIVNVEGTSESTVLDHINKVLLPELEISKDTHEVETTVLTSFKGTSKVQISAIEKKVLAPIRGAAKKSAVKISAVSPLTWTLKSIISLEPSISILQMGAHLYVAQHYIGVDQANSYPITEYDSIVETIKTLKGAEPSIQSIYLVSSALVEEDLKEKLSDTIPIQQLAVFKEDDSKMPSYIRFIIESSMKTLAIEDFPVPKFNIGKATEEDILSLTHTPVVASDDTNDEDDETEEELPTPISQTLSSKTVESTSDISPVVENTESTPMKDEDQKSKTEEKELPAIPEIDTSPSDESNITSETSTPASEPKVTAENLDDVKPSTSTPAKAETPVTPIIDTKAESEEIDLAQFAGKDTNDDSEIIINDPAKTETVSSDAKILDKPQKKVIKNSAGVNNMLKMVFITIAVFFITIAIGVGVGLGLLKMSENKTEEATPTVVTETPEQTPTPTPTPEVVEINKEELSILVVNATTKAGYAGQVKTLLVDAGIEDVTAGNAQGEYEEGTDILLMKEENSALKTLLEESTELTFEYSDSIDVEDAAQKYDAVIVLAK
jgi:hypothetical protein